MWLYWRHVAAGLSVSAVGPDELERRLRERLDALGLAPRAELLHILTLPDFERADRIGEFLGYPQSRPFAELLTDAEGTGPLPAVLVGMLREAEGETSESSGCVVPIIVG